MVCYDDRLEFIRYSVFFGDFCLYCKCETATYGAFFVYHWSELKMYWFFVKTLFCKLKAENNGGK